MITVKIGGSVFDELHETIMCDIKDVIRNNKIVFVHGGGKEVSKACEKMGIEPKFLISPSGIKSRYTDKETIEIFTMIMAGKINKTITKLLQKNNINAFGISGIDGNLIQADRKKKLMIVNEKGRKQFVDGGYTGKIKNINTSILNLLLDNNYIPVIAPIAVSENYEFLNVDGDRAASNISGSLKMNDLLFLTNVDGLFINDKLVNEISYDQIKKIRNKIGHGMEKKILASIEAIDMGVNRIIIANGKKKNPIRSALEHHKCTVIQK